ncbi:hypothetical protein NQ314_002201 [Rhamnusium bicolor]|uniref:Cell cycle checkpoint protein RAD17 n=1 Tax=Rhamnusium bicolor TaxID=1586634 RepID=A0AAV8ZS25_9CUCU|nr:hypothetical protein NQ314_002201 [Rhamnusium bicolor]
MKRSRAREWKTFDFGPELKSPVKNVNKKTSRNMDPEQVTADFRNTVTESQTFNFSKNIAPKTITDLAVHPKKIQEVEEWLKLNVANQKMNYSSFLLLSGPTGSGKTATINVLCKKMEISVSEWVNPMDQDYELFRGPSQLKRFVEFLIESKWNSLLEIGNFKRITLVKDFPNAIIYQPEEFIDVLEECYYKTKNPIIFICTDASTGGINLSRTLFPEETINKYNITHIR